MTKERKYQKNNSDDNKIQDNLVVSRVEYFDEDFIDVEKAVPFFLTNGVGELKVDAEGRKYFLDAFNKKNIPTLYRVFESDIKARNALKNKELLIGEMFCLVRSTLKDAFPEVKGSIKEVRKYLDSYDIYWTFSSDEKKQEEIKNIVENLEYKPYIKK